MSVKRNSSDLKLLCEKVQSLIEGKLNTFKAKDGKSAWELADIHFKYTVLAAYFFPLFDDDIEVIGYALELAAMSKDDRDKVGMFTNIGWFGWHMRMVQDETEWISYEWLAKCVYNYMAWKLTGEIKYGEIIEWKPENA